MECSIGFQNLRKGIKFWKTKRERRRRGSSKKYRNNITMDTCLFKTLRDMKPMRSHLKKKI